jgi:SH3 domain-containing YSC84-like protein 1
MFGAKPIRCVAGVILLAVLFLHAAPCRGLSFDEADSRITASNGVLKQVLEMPDGGIPRDLLQRCRAVAIFPGVVKLGAIVGLSFGSGIVVHRDEKTDRWGKPAFFTIREGSFGLQAGAQATDLILLIMSEQGVQGLLEQKFALGADISVAAGPIGRDASAQTNMGFTSGILSYSRSRGIFAGLSLQGAVLESDKTSNEVYHGPGISVQDVLYEDKGSRSDAARKLIEALDNAG